MNRFGHADKWVSLDSAQGHSQKNASEDAYGGTLCQAPCLKDTIAWNLYCGRLVSVYIRSLGEPPRSGFPSFGYPAEQF